MSITYGVTDQGFVLKDLDTLKAELETDFQGEFGANLSLDPLEPAGQLIGILADRFASLWEVAEDTYLSFSPDDATGVSLDNLSGLTGTLRLQQVYSLVTVTATGTPGTVLPAGRIFKTSDTGARFATLAGATIGGGGTISVACQAVLPGVVSALAGTLTVIETPVAGLSSVTNPLDAVAGAPQEPDPYLRVTRESELQSGGKASAPAIRAALLKVSGVTAATVFVNDEPTTNADSMPPWTIECLVTGGTDAAVAKCIFDNKGGGSQTQGVTTVAVTDQDGNSHNILFTRPTITSVYVIANVQVDATKYPGGGDALVQAAIDNWGDANLVSGRDVVAAALSAQAFTVPGVLDCQVLIGTAPSPVASTTISINPRHQADLDSSRTTVVSTPVTP